MRLPRGPRPGEKTYDYHVVSGLQSKHRPRTELREIRAISANSSRASGGRRFCASPCGARIDLRVECEASGQRPVHTRLEAFFMAPLGHILIVDDEEAICWGL